MHVLYMKIGIARGSILMDMRVYRAGGFYFVICGPIVGENVYVTICCRNAQPCTVYV